MRGCKGATHSGAIFCLYSSFALASRVACFSKVTLQVDVCLFAGARRAAGGKFPATSRGSSQADGTLAALSRQLVQAKMAEADAQRKHR